MLEAEQEKVIKQNQRLMDERKDRREDAQRRVRDLNARFADWYYVIPEATYSKLRFKRADLFEQPAGVGQPQAPGHSRSAWRPSPSSTFRVHPETDRPDTQTIRRHSKS